MNVQMDRVLTRHCELRCLRLLPKESPLLPLIFDRISKSMLAATLLSNAIIRQPPLAQADHCSNMDQQQPNQVTVAPRCSTEDAPVDYFAEGSFVKQELLGTGERGEVFAARCGRQRYALKIIPVPVANPEPQMFPVFLPDVSIEADVQEEFAHPNILRCVDARYSDDGSNFHLFSELARCGDIERVVKRFGFVERHTARRFFFQIVDGLRAIHSKNYAHRDIKPSNILVFGKNSVKIGDLGSAKPKARYSDLVYKLGAHGYYIPPEMLYANTYYADGVAWDLYGAAMVYIYMLLGKHPWDLTNRCDPEYDAFCRGKLEELIAIDSRWERARKDFWFVRRLLHHDPLKRILPLRYFGGM